LIWFSDTKSKPDHEARERWPVRLFVKHMCKAPVCAENLNT
jgi:hypothetical protein